MSEIDSGYFVTEIRSLGGDTFKIVLINDTSGDGFAIDVADYSTIEDVDFDDMVKNAIDSRLDELEAVLVDQAERIAEGASQQGRKGNQGKKTAKQPVVSSPTPADSAIDVLISTTTLSFTITDPNGDNMDYSVVTTPDVGTASDTGVSDGSYDITVSGLAYSTIYEWEITVDDNDVETVVVTYSFTTEASP